MTLKAAICFGIVFCLVALSCSNVHALNNNGTSVLEETPITSATNYSNDELGSAGVDSTSEPDLLLNNGSTVDVALPVSPTVPMNTTKAIGGSLFQPKTSAREQEHNVPVSINDTRASEETVFLKPRKEAKKQMKASIVIIILISVTILVTGTVLFIKKHYGNDIELLFGWCYSD